MNTSSCDHKNSSPFSAITNNCRRCFQRFQGYKSEAMMSEVINQRKFSLLGTNIPPKYSHQTLKAIGKDNNFASMSLAVMRCPSIPHKQKLLNDLIRNNHFHAAHAFLCSTSSQIKLYKRELTHIMHHVKEIPPETLFTLFCFTSRYERRSLFEVLSTMVYMQDMFMMMDQHPNLFQFISQFSKDSYLERFIHYWTGRELAKYLPLDIAKYITKF